MDPLVCVIICLFILKVGITILKDAISNMLDTSCGDEWNSGKVNL